MKTRRTLAALVTVSALTLASVPVAQASAAAAGGVVTAQVDQRITSEYYYTLKSGTVRLVLAPAFMKELRSSGATLEAIAPAVLRVDKRTGLTSVTFKAKPDDAAVVFADSRTVYFYTDGGMRLSGNGTSVDLTNNLFAFDDVTQIDFVPNGLDFEDGYAVGPLMRMPKKATRNAVAFTSPKFVMQPAFRDLLRGTVDEETGLADGPMAQIADRDFPFGFAQVAIQVRQIQ